MADIQIPLTLVADTGTGALMHPHRLSGDIALYREASPVAAPAFLQMKREEPKPTKDYAGAAKTFVRFNRQYPDTLGRLWPAVGSVNVSVPAFLTDAQKIAFVTEMTLAFSTAESRAALATQAIPQS